MKLGMRRIRTKGIWLLILPFFWFARPTAELLVAGAALTAVGLVIRALAAGYIHKDRKLTTTGPYAHTRNPLYLGTFLLGLGVTVAGGHWAFVVVFVVFFWAIYGKTIRGERDLLTELFGDDYREYARNVPLLFPRLTPWRQREAQSDFAFDGARYRRNREWEALLGAVAGYAVLVVRMVTL